MISNDSKLKLWRNEKKHFDYKKNLIKFIVDYKEIKLRELEKKFLEFIRQFDLNGLSDPHL